MLTNLGLPSAKLHSTVASSPNPLWAALDKTHLAIIAHHRPTPCPGMGWKQKDPQTQAGSSPERRDIEAVSLYKIISSVLSTD